MWVFQRRTNAACSPENGGALCETCGFGRMDRVESEKPETPTTSVPGYGRVRATAVFVVSFRSRVRTKRSLRPKTHQVSNAERYCVYKYIFFFSTTTTAVFCDNLSTRTSFFPSTASYKRPTRSNGTRTRSNEISFFDTRVHRRHRTANDEKRTITEKNRFVRIVCNIFFNVPNKIYRPKFRPTGLYPQNDRVQFRKIRS